MFGLGLDSLEQHHARLSGSRRCRYDRCRIVPIDYHSTEKAEARQAAQEFGLYKLDTERKIADANALGEAAKADVARAELKLAEYRRVVGKYWERRETRIYSFPK